jgi:hypothetical protein
MEHGRPPSLVNFYITGKQKTNEDQKAANSTSFNISWKCNGPFATPPPPPPRRKFIIWSIIWAVEMKLNMLVHVS